MFVGVGIDLVEIQRFNQWKYYSRKQLLRIFSDDEINYAFDNPAKTSERLAVRFAAKEAFFKALYSCRTTSLPFLTSCRAVQVGIGKPPKLEICTDLLNDYLSVPYTYDTILSLTHTGITAGAVVILHN